MMGIAQSMIKTSTGYTVYDLLGPIEETGDQIKTLQLAFPVNDYGTEIVYDTIVDGGRRSQIRRHDYFPSGGSK